MSDRELQAAVSTCLGKSYEELPCYKLLELLLPSWPPEHFEEVDVNWMHIGDVVAFDKDKFDSNACIGVYLGNGKVVASVPSHGVVLVPWRLVREQFIWGGRCG